MPQTDASLMCSLLSVFLILSNGRNAFDSWPGRAAHSPKLINLDFKLIQPSCSTNFLLVASGFADVANFSTGLVLLTDLKTFELQKL